MKRVDVHYGGQVYSIGGRSVEDLKAEVADALTSGDPWICVNDGEGDPREAHLYISEGVSLAFVPIPGPEADADVQA